MCTAILDRVNVLTFTKNEHINLIELKAFIVTISQLINGRQGNPGTHHLSLKEACFKSCFFRHSGGIPWWLKHQSDLSLVNGRQRF